MATTKMMVINTMLDNITRDMQTSIPTSDSSRADVVKIGRFQADPLKNNIYVAISPSDPEKIEWADGIVTLESMQSIGFVIEPREIGGGEVWWRRGVVQLGCYFIEEKYTEDIAMDASHTAMARLLKSIEDTNISGIVDDFGETAVLLLASTYQFSEGGGPPRSYIWRGKVWWQCLTERV